MKPMRTTALWRMPALVLALFCAPLLADMRVKPSPPTHGVVTVIRQTADSIVLAWQTADCGSVSGNRSSVICYITWLVGTHAVRHIQPPSAAPVVDTLRWRLEERRVGKGGRSRWGPY